MKKFWNKSADSADIYIYGEIGAYDVSDKSFVEDLNSYGNVPVTVHINSGGGDVFAGLAISNVIKERGNVTVSIDGLAASAASLVAMGGAKIIMANNALMMIHEPVVELYGLFNSDELSEAQNSLAAIHDAIVATYASRVKNFDIESLLAAETWFSAKEALDAGLIDEIIGEADIKVDDAAQMMFVNSLAFSTKKFDTAKIRRAMGETQMSIDQKYLASVRTAEINRIKALSKLRGDNSVVNALIDTAIERGDSVEKITPYLDAVKTAPVGNAIVNVIRDQMNSGAENVAGGQDGATAADFKAAYAKRVADLANAMMR